MLAHAFGAAFDNPDLHRRWRWSATARPRPGPLEGSWKGDQLPQPGARRRRAADPPPQRLQDRRADGARAAPTRRGVRSLLRGHGYDAASSRETTRRGSTRRSPTALDALLRADPRHPAARARSGGAAARPRWPLIVLRTPKGWTGPESVDGVQVEGTFRAHQVPLSRSAREPGAPPDARGVAAVLPAGGAVRRDGRLVPRARCALGPEGDRRMSANPHANGGRCSCRSRPARLTRLRRGRDDAGGRERHESTRRLGRAAARRLRRATPTRRTSGSSAPTRRTATGSGPCSRRPTALRGRTASRRRPRLAPDGRVMEVLSRAQLRRAGSRATCSPAGTGCSRRTRRSPWSSASMAIQHAKWLRGVPRPALAGAGRRRSTSCSPRPCWRNDHNGFSHQGPGLIDT